MDELQFVSAQGSIGSVLLLEKPSVTQCLLIRASRRAARIPVADRLSLQSALFIVRPRLPNTGSHMRGTPSSDALPHEHVELI